MKEIASLILPRCNRVGDFVGIVKVAAERAVRDGSATVGVAHVEAAITEREKRRIN